jgi:hypothetical protein
MKTRLAVFLLAMAAAAAAQSSNWYIFAAPGAVHQRWFGTKSSVHAGAGFDAVVTKGLGLNMEIGGLRFGASNRGLLSLGGSYHIFHDEQRKADPFVGGGGSLMVAIGVANLFYFGGGANYWLGRKFGLRVEFRDHSADRNPLLRRADRAGGSPAQVGSHAL